MTVENLPSIFIDTFAFYYEQLVAGETGLIRESDIQPVTDLPDADLLPDEYVEAGEAALAKTAVIKLNGGLGTSMGLEQAKSLLVVKDNLTFLDIIACQSLMIDVPLILMNSFATRDDSLALLEKYPDLWGQLPLDFIQHKAPKVTQSDFSPVAWPDNPELEWCPPGHGDIYTSLMTSGTLDALLAAGYEYAFVSNADNLGAVVDKAILGYFAAHKLPFMMEVADRTQMDRKGGHLARQADGRLVLREVAQCPPEDLNSFQDISRHKYFNTNNLWLHLPTLKQVMVERDYRLGLPMIRNAKTVDPRDPNSTPVYQLETAMGTAVSVFAGAQAIRVPRSRFAPVKRTEDLLAVRSDAYTLTEDFHIVPSAYRQMRHFVVTLDDRHYKFISDLDARFPEGAPSLVNCTRFEVKGNFYFGRDVVCSGEVQLVNDSEEPHFVADGAILSDNYALGDNGRPAILHTLPQ
ncbi:MAG: UTP--glucose-1-phosphate uridylyltransferase [Ardenticatenaceae bacterium]|nr:UTP--glucose-1-phosphate uridylyltransferase [Ardenticatenaceae bacterium]